MCCVACTVSWATWLLFTGAPARSVVLRVRCPGPLGSCSPVCLLGALCCVCGVLCSLAPVHRCARSLCCLVCAVSWATWLLFTGAPTRCVALCVPCPGPLGSCLPVCLLDVLCWVCGVLEPLPPVHRCARSVCCLAFAVSWAPWLTVHRCARSVCRVLCAVSWAPWLLFTGAPARFVVLRVRCRRPLSSCSPVCPHGVLCCADGVLAPWLVITGVLARCGVLCVACTGGRCRAHTRPSGRRPFVAGRGWVPSGRALVPPDGDCFIPGRGLVPSGRALVHPDSGCSVAGRGWVRCRARTRLSGRRLVLLGTCSRAVVCCVSCALSGFAAPGGRCCLAPVRVPWLLPAACLSGVPRGPVCCATPHPVRSLLVLQSAFPTPCSLPPPRGFAPPALLGGCAGHAEGGREPG